MFQIEENNIVLLTVVLVYVVVVKNTISKLGNPVPDTR